MQVIYSFTENLKTPLISWDANGNMTNLYNVETDNNRGMCWDEENRLMLVRDNDSQFSNYVYNAGGDRVWKLTGAIERMSVNGEDFIDQAILDKTLYTSPYMILTDKEYTKHYYIENQRITTKLGGGMATNLVNPISGTLDPIEGDVNIKAQNLMENLIAYSCTEGVMIEIEPIFRSIEELMNQDNEERDLYFYHGDHLGSSSWITDASGNVNQHLQYMPFGEGFIDQRSETDIRFKFTGKERDIETGLDYFGARYYASDLSIWLSVDPLASKYPSLSSYVYVENDPVNYIDEEGENPLAIIGAVVGGATEIVSQTISNGIANNVNGDGFFKGWGKKMDWADVGISTVEGAVAGLTGGASLLITKGVAGAARSAIDFKSENGLKVAGGSGKYHKEWADVGLDLAGEALSFGLGKVSGLDKIDFQPSPVKADLGGAIMEIGMKGIFNGVWGYGINEGKNYIKKRFPGSIKIKKNLPEVEIYGDNKNRNYEIMQKHKKKCEKYYPN